MCETSERETPDRRSAIMAAVKTKDTGPELAVRRLLYRRGYRYRIHCRDLPGTPDIVFRGRKKAVFVHGCFWHGHDCRGGRLPKSRLDYWAPKIEANGKRDARNLTELEQAGWQAMVLWQCELRAPDAALGKLIAFLETGR